MGPPAHISGAIPPFAFPMPFCSPLVTCIRPPMSEVQALVQQLRHAQQKKEDRHLDAELARLQAQLTYLDQYSHDLDRLEAAVAALPPDRHAPARGRDAGPGSDEERVVLIVDRDNRGQKFLDTVSAVPPEWTVHVVYNPASKHAILHKPAGDVRYHPSLSGVKDCNAATVAFVAGEVSVEADPKRTTVYFVYCDEHEGRHEEVPVLCAVMWGRGAGGGGGGQMKGVGGGGG